MLHNVVNIALTGGAHDHVTVHHAHVDYSFSEVKVFVHLVETVTHVDLVVFVQHSFDVRPLHVAVDDIAESNGSTATSSSNSSTVMTPAQIEKRARSRLVKGVRPA